MSFVHLHAHQEFSLLDGCGTAAQHVGRAVDNKQSALALTDHGTLAGILHHLTACEEAGVKGIFGMEAYFRWDRLSRHPNNKHYYHLLLLARTQEGWANLMRMSSEAHRSGFWSKPCVDWDLLTKYGDGIMVGSACLSSYLSRLLLDYLNGMEQKYWQAAIEYVKKMKRAFGENFFIEIMPNAVPAQKLINPYLVALANLTATPFIASVDVHVPYRDWTDTRDVLFMINTQQTITERTIKREQGEDVYSMSEPTLFLMSEGEVRQAFLDNHPDLGMQTIEEAIESSGFIADEIQRVAIDKGDKLPSVAKAGIESPEVLIRSWCEEGLKRVGKKGDEQYRDRMEYELSVIISKGVLDYFVIIGDMVRWARANNIRTGAGRGSAAGCLVSYLIGITAIDPVAHGLLFERFLNPDRQGLPDIDIDFRHDRRDEVKEYLSRRWGKEHVMEVSAFQRFGLRSALDGPARVFDVPFHEVKRVTKSLDDAGGDLHLEAVREVSSALDAFATKHPEVWMHALRLEGQVKGVSRHPAGVIVTDKPVTEYMPTIRGANGVGMVTAWSESTTFRVISDYGFLKIDCLATDGLTVQELALDHIEETTGIRPNIESLPVVSDPEDVDPKVMSIFTSGSTLGVFQFESHGLSGLTRQIKPTRFKDLCAANALHRPGPLDAGIAYEYGDRKNGRKKASYWHPSIEPILRDTYGLMIYQEQVMELCRMLAGFTMAEADDVRRAITKHSSARVLDNQGAAEMSRMRDRFIAGCLSKLRRAEATDIWSRMVKFSRYGFNASHAAGYTLQAYQDAWIKAYHPLSFFAAVMTVEEKKIPILIREARGLGVNVLPPCINSSQPGFSLDDGGIRFGLSAIKYVGGAALEEILNKRPFKDLNDFESKIVRRRCNARVVLALTRAGALDIFGARQTWSNEERIAGERENLGFAPSASDVVGQYRDYIAERIETEQRFDDIGNRERIKAGGEIVGIRKIMTKHRQQMAFVDIAFGEDHWSCTFFPPVYARCECLLQEGSVVLVHGTKDAKRNCILVDGACSLEKVIAEEAAVCAA
jgi:DNA polymerase III subunit alpha